MFDVGMVGYPESLTDPPHAGQILVIIFLLVGKYGVLGDDLDALGMHKNFESDRIHVKAVVVSDYSYEASHYTARRTLSEWLKQHRMPGMYGIDTRAITKVLRNHGSMLGKLVVDGDTVGVEMQLDDPNTQNIVELVS